MNELKKLQAEYNKLHERLGYTENPSTIAAINKELDKIVEKMDQIINK